jgi:hypothetical protein
MAFRIFCEARVDVAIVEVGIGGLLIWLQKFFWKILEKCIIYLWNRKISRKILKKNHINHQRRNTSTFLWGGLPIKGNNVDFLTRYGKILNFLGENFDFFLPRKRKISKFSLLKEEIFAPPPICGTLL